MIRFWNASTGAPNGEVSVANHDTSGDLRMYAVSYAPDGGLLATAHFDGAVRIWEAEPLKLRTRFNLPSRFIHGAIAFSPDGLWLATGSIDGSVNVWDFLAGKCVRSMGRHESDVYTLSFGRDVRHSGQRRIRKPLLRLGRTSAGRRLGR